MKLSIILLRFLMRKKRVIKGLAPHNFNNICVFSNTAIGDTLFNTPVFRELKKAYPKSKITAILNPKNASLFATNPNIDEILLYDGRWRGFFKILKELKKENAKWLYFCIQMSHKLRHWRYLLGLNTSINSQMIKMSLIFGIQTRLWGLKSYNMWCLID